MLNQKQLKHFMYTTLAEIKSVTGGRDNLVCFCSETNTWYKYLVAGSGYIANDQNILITGDGGNTRWIAIAGKYMSTFGDTVYTGTNHGTKLAANTPTWANKDILKTAYDDVYGNYIEFNVPGYSENWASLKFNETGILWVNDGVIAPNYSISGMAGIYVDSVDGDLKIRFADGTVKTIVTDS